MDKKKILWSLVSILIAIFTIKAVVAQNQGFSLREFSLFLKEANPLFLSLAAICMCGYFFFEGLAVARMARILGYGKKRFGTVYGAADVYFSAITPSASGGQPASAYFMIQDGIPASVTTAILLANLVMYTLVLLLFGFFSLFTNLKLFLVYSPLSKALVILGSVAMFFLGVLFLLLLRFGRFLKHICNFLIGLLWRMKIIKNKDHLSRKLEKTLEEYHQCASLMLGHKKLMAETFFWNFMQRFSQVAVSFLVFLAADYGLATAKMAWHIQNLTVLGSNIVPVPGAMGVADYLMLEGYKGLLGSEEIAVHMELLCRSISFYGCIITSGIIVLTGIIVRKVHK